MDVKWRLCFLKFSIILYFMPLINSVDIDNVTDLVFEGGGAEINGVLAAFGDYDADKLIDLFFIMENGKKAGIYFANDHERIFNKSPLIVCTVHDDDLIITSIVPGDFNGDSKMDVLLTMRNNKNQIIVKIFAGNISRDTKFNCDRPELNIYNMSVEPLVMDYNGDMIPDLYGETVEGIRTVWIIKQINSSSWIANAENVTKDLVQRIRPIHSNAFVNLMTDNLSADILVTTADNSFELWPYENGYIKHFKHAFPDASVIGQSAFLDIDLDGNLDHIVSVCSDSSCLNATIRVRHNYNNTDGDWVAVMSTGKLEPDHDTNWGFYNTDKYPITLHVGDYNLDGYPDLLTIINYNGTVREAVILENINCPGCQFKRTFKVRRLFKNVKNVVLAAFYDIYQDGNLDFLFISHNDTTNTYNVSAFQNKIESDVCFLKILVLSGLTDVKKTKLYGVNQPGPFIRYRTTQLDGSPQKSCAAQLSQSSHFALQLPYTVFGLGQTPNFVDELEVGIPQSAEFNEKYTEKTWKSIIPNSQMIVVPLRNDKTIKWYSLLFVKPFSHQVIIALIALAGTCVLIVLIIGGLHWKEVIADRKERLQEAHKFHFDAM